MKLVVTAQAVEDLQHIEDYIGKDNPKAAVDFVERLTERFRELTQTPGMGRPQNDLAAGMRSSSVGDYLIFYQVHRDNLVIVHVLHGRRDLPRIFALE